MATSPTRRRPGSRRWKARSTRLRARFGDEAIGKELAVPGCRSAGDTDEPAISRKLPPEEEDPDA